ncbi:MAG: methionyl-tRNA formyltransferase [Candidatus Eisenbacteria bacterium]|nr:methionyl-tRNA formyltransferase [Candidatus Eisenbacteria bacterium]
MRIVFMGTPQFAVPSLTKVHARGHEVALVVTQPDRPAGRGLRLCCPPVKEAATVLGLPVAQVETVNCDEFTARLGALAPDVVVVVAFGQILCESILAAPTKGAVNVHASLLPRYRGVAPINWAIVNGEKETGVTTMFMARKVDAGEIILMRGTPIGPRETAGELYARLAEMGGDLLVETLDLIEAGRAPRVVQDPALVSYARKLTRADGEVVWDRPAGRVFDHVRGMTPWPGAHTRFKGKALEVLRAEPGDAAGRRGAPGEIVAMDRTKGIEVATADGTVWLLEVKPEGKGAMAATAFARGYRPAAGDRLGVRPPPPEA